MPRLQKPASDKQKFDRTTARRASPDRADGVSSPFVGAGEEALLSRSGYSNPRGKLTAEVKIRLADETHAVLSLRAAEHGVPLGELVRLLLECAAHGVDAVADLNADRIRRVGALMGANGSHEVAR